MHKNDQLMHLDAKVQLNILGAFDLRVDGQPLPSSLGHSLKLRSILCYLILFRERAVPREELMEAFYADENQSNPESALKMQILRIKKALMPLLGEDTVPIISHRGAYQWNPEISCWVDAEAFEQLSAQADDIARENEERLDAYKQALSLYQGDIILEKDSLLWSKTLASRYHTKYIGVTERYVTLLDQTGNYSEIENVCLAAVESAPANEKLYILLIQALLKQRKYAEARTYYKNIVDILYKELGVQPSAELQQLYAQCASEEKPWEQDLSLVMEDMRDPVDKREAFFCGFEQFKQIYQLEIRRAQRTGGCLHVAMLTITGRDGRIMDTKVGSMIMERVQQTILTNLRQSDVVARYSNCQFIIMLPFANQEDSYSVMERVVNAYRMRNPYHTIQLSYQIRELELVP